MTVNIRELSPELAKKAKDELFEEPERIDQDIATIKDWLSKQPHINARTDDQWLVAFLRGCKYSLERTKEKLDLFYTMKSIAPELTVAVDPLSPGVQEVLKSGACLPLIKNYKPDEPRVMFIRPGRIDPNKIPVIDIMRVTIMFSYIQIFEDDVTVVAGQTYIVDMSDLGLSHLTQMTPSLVKKMILTRQDAFPIRQKGISHLNPPPAAEKLFNIFKLFMNEKMKSRWHIYTDTSSLHKVISKAILPPEYGGDGDSVQYLIDYWKTKVESYRDWFLEDAQYKTDESKRPGAPKTSETLFGIEGSFRQLNVD